MEPYSSLRVLDKPEWFFHQLQGVAVEEIKLNKEVMTEKEIEAWKKVK